VSLCKVARGTLIMEFKYILIIIIHRYNATEELIRHSPRKYYRASIITRYSEFNLQELGGKQRALEDMRICLSRMSVVR
jgi:hypothetical protein